MKEIILLTCLVAIASALPHPERPFVGFPFIPKDFRSDSIPEELAPQVEDLNTDDAFAPNAISINFVHITPQQALQDFIELVKVAEHAFEAQSEEIKIAPFPLNPEDVEPIQIVNVLPVENELPSDNVEANKVMVVDNAIDDAQVEYQQPQEDVSPQESNIEVEKVHVVDSPVQEEQNEVIRVASIPIDNSAHAISPDVDNVMGVKFVETPNVDGDEAFVGVPSVIAPSELDSLRVDFNENPASISLGDAKEPRFNYPNNLYNDPMLR